MTQSRSRPQCVLPSRFAIGPSRRYRYFGKLISPTRVCVIYFRVQTSSSHTISHSQSHLRAPMTGSSMSRRRHPFVMT
jgi:hypothetical protein